MDFVALICSPYTLVIDITVLVSYDFQTEFKRQLVRRFVFADLESSDCVR